MKKLTRRTALAAVPALAATPLLAAGVPFSADPLTLSPRFAELFVRWKTHTDAGNAAGAEATRMEMAAEVREGIVKPAPFSSAEDLPAGNAYFNKVKTLPEHAEVRRLDKLASEQWQRAWRYTDELVELQPETLGDLAAQLEAHIGSETPDNIGDKILLDVPGHIRRLAGAS